MKQLMMLFFLGLLVTSTGWAQSSELVERTFSGVSSDKTPQGAKHDIQDQAAQKISEDLIKELIGEERYAKNKTLIQNRIEKLWNRYIPFSKASELTQDGTQYKMTVTLRVSVKDLRTLLQENSLLAENDTVPLVLPIIAFTDRVELKSFRWWKPEEVHTKAFLISENRHFENALRAAFQKYNFYVIKSLTLGLQIPKTYQNERLSLDDMQYLSQYFGAPLMIEGQVQFGKSPDASNRYRIEVKLSAVQVSNGRPIADVSRRFETEIGMFEAAIDKKLKDVVDSTSQDLATQVFEAWQRGTLGTTVLRLTFRGKVPFNKLEAFKDRVKSQVKDIRNIRERLLTGESVSYDVDTSLGAKDFATHMGILDIDGQRWTPVSQTDSEVILQLQR